MSAELAVRDVDDAATRAALEVTWAPPRGVLGLLGTVNHKVVAIRYIVSAFVFFALAGVLALVMRAQLAYPEARLVGPDLYNQIFTVHGSTMMFLFAVPVMEAMGLYLVPLMVGRVRHGGPVKGRTWRTTAPICAGPASRPPDGGNGRASRPRPRRRALRPTRPCRR